MTDQARKFPVALIAALLVQTIGGLVWGLLTWYFNERVYRALYSNHKNIR